MKNDKLQHRIKQLELKLERTMELNKKSKDDDTIKIRQYESELEQIERFTDANLADYEKLKGELVKYK